MIDPHLAILGFKLLSELVVGDSILEWLTLFTLLGGLAGLYHRFECHAPGCKWPSTHKFTDEKTGEVHQVCHRHHPDAKSKAHWWNRTKVHDLEHIQKAYRKQSIRLAIHDDGDAVAVEKQALPAKPK